MSWYLLPLLVGQEGLSQPNLGDAFSTGAKLAIAIGVLVGSFGLGIILSRALRMPDYGVKIGVVLTTFIAGIVIVALGWPPKLGIDLSGGVVLVYEVDRAALEHSNLEQMANRLNSQLGKDRNAKTSARVNDRKIEILIPKGSDLKIADDAAANVTDLGFALTRTGQRTEEDHTIVSYTYAVRRADQAIDMEKMIGAVKRRIDPTGVQELTVRQFGNDQLEIIIPEVNQQEIERIKRQITELGALEFRIVANPRDSKFRHIVELARRNPGGREVYDGPTVVGRWYNLANPEEGDEAYTRRNKAGGVEILMAVDKFNVGGEYLQRAVPGNDRNGRPCVNFSFDSTGARLFGALTGTNLPDENTGMRRRLGIILDKEMISAPNIQSKITADGEITGGFTKERVDSLVNVLNAGSLPAALNKQPLSHQNISAQLGADTIRSGSNAMIISTVAVVLFMLIYYRFSGMVADIAVIMNMVLAVALMILVKAAFTLPGLAGLVLTVGMAVDANVLIYERMREESQRGASLRMAIRNGFARAMSTIIDSNLTTVISAVVLYVIGTDQIKGFAVSLILGLVVSMYTAIFVARVIFDIAERKRWITRLNMMQMVRETHIDFVKWRMPAIVASLIVIAIGMIAVASRRSDLLDIDFTGGTSVQMRLAAGHSRDIAEVRKELADLPDVAVSGVGTEDRDFKIDTSEQDINIVEETLKKKFAGALETYAMNYDNLEVKKPPVKTEAESPKPGPSAEATPDAAKPDDVKPAVIKPSDDAKPSDEKPAKPSDEPGKESSAKEPETGAAPDSKKSGRVILRSDNQLALGGPLNPAAIALLLGQADAPATLEKQEAKQDQKAAPAKPGAAGTVDPVSEKPSTPAAQADTDPPPAKTDDAKTDDAKGDAGGTKPAAGSTAKKPDDTESAFKLPGRNEPGGKASESTELGSLTGTHVDLHFNQAINHTTLGDMINKQFEAAKIAASRFELNNPQYDSGSSSPYKDWSLDIELPPEEARVLLDGIRARLAETPVFPSSNVIGPKVAGDTTMMAIYALLASLVMIVIYVWVRFQNVMFGLAAVLALIHDVLVTLGFLALSSYLANYLGMEVLLVDPFKISLAVVAALLTIVGYSINDTIVIFDRIREIRGKSPELTEKMINDSVNQTLSRTLLTSGTVLIGTLILYIAGGQGIHPFAYAMLVGLISGTYSTVYIASPVLLWLKKPLDRPIGRTANSVQPTAAGFPKGSRGR